MQFIPNIIFKFIKEQFGELITCDPQFNEKEEIKPHQLSPQQQLPQQQPPQIKKVEIKSKNIFEGEKWLK